MPEREERLDAPLRVAPVADEYALVEHCRRALAGELQRGLIDADEVGLLLGCREADRQPAGGVGITEEHVRDRLALCFAGVPGLDHRSTSSSQGIVTGPPVARTTIVFGLASATAAIRRSWSCGSCREWRSASSPSMVLATTTATSAFCAARTASWICGEACALGGSHANRTDAFGRGGPQHWPGASSW